MKKSNKKYFEITRINYLFVYLLDFALVYIPLYFLFIYYFDNKNIFDIEGIGLFPYLYGTTKIVYFISIFLINTIFGYLNNGSSVGMKLAYVMLVEKNNENIEFFRFLYKNVLIFLYFNPVVMIINLLCILFLNKSFTELLTNSKFVFEEHNIMKL